MTIFLWWAQWLVVLVVALFGIWQLASAVDAYFTPRCTWCGRRTDGAGLHFCRAGAVPSIWRAP
jgi:hypothetical protein